MDTSKLKKFAQSARKDLLEQVSSKLAFILKPESSARREYPAVVKELEKALAAQGQAGLIDQVAYTWFNRFCALRFMDVNGYNRVGVVSPAEGQVQPEILAEAKSGIIDDNQFTPSVIDQIRGLLNGSISSPDAQTEAYRLLIVGFCNTLYERMPYMFERIQDFTELLMPDDLLSENSLLANMREVMTSEACQDVEIIGWLYQFYISEKKQDVFDGLKKNIKITAENIPAATQLFTPHWIVRYLVENSLGRLWMLNRPSSKLTEHMEYYIAPEEPEADFLKVSSPEEIRICDPAAGSGHMLTYAFELLYAIYEEEGYGATDIPALILANNLFGIEIDDRAGALASFALEMKAAEKLGRRRFFKMDVKPNICVLENISFSESEMNDVIAIVGKDLYTAELRETLTQFEQAKNFGSLIVPKLKDPSETARLIEAKDFSGDMLLSEVYERLFKVLRMAEVLSPKYHVVVANPPYAGASGLNPILKSWTAANFPSAKADLFAMFMVRGIGLCAKFGILSMINMQSWMFLAAYEKLRSNILNDATILSLAHIGERGFDSIGGSVVSTVAFVIRTEADSSFSGDFIRLVDGRNEKQKKDALRSKASHEHFRIPSSAFSSIPGSPISYWSSPSALQTFSEHGPLSVKVDTRIGLITGDNNRYIRNWSEVSRERVGIGFDRNSTADSSKKWFPQSKGGEYRKWFGNHDTLLDWSNDGQELQNRMHSSGTRTLAHNFNLDKVFLGAATWTKISTGSISARIQPEGFLFNDASANAFPTQNTSEAAVVGLLCSKITTCLLPLLNPTLNYLPGTIGALPVALPLDKGSQAELRAKELIAISKSDWDAYETSWDFTTLPLLSPDHRAGTLESTYTTLRTHWQGLTDEMQRLEEENNRIFIDAYGLQDELTPKVPIEEITLTCNPAYRYGVKGTEADRETRLRADTMAEFLSYAVGCMFGRYSLDAPGLILANQGERLEDYLARVPEPSFMPDDENVIPMIDFEGDWFEDDITERFKQFVRVAFGDEHYSENLAFIEQALGKPLQKYFVKDFYKDHVSRYKKRPIYWLFSSPKGTFNALIYMHRYRPGTVSVVLNEYLREFRTKLEARKASCEQISISASASQKEKTQALKMIGKLDKAINEINSYERDVLYPLAGRNIEIDLDNGVKHNYPLFGPALKNVAGLS
ncbi:BREX-1 system adenine-specific DNA-methyltransferase PglX [Vreelandella venusta]|uniref:BREX-1 system adenine-specific DNA-methyltransferase PglX n=1 Tax=Vreelandella venusta TaxID=44935 RepID=UPI003AA8D73C